MPGIWGAVGESAPLFGQLHAMCSTVWRDAHAVIQSFASLGGHSHRDEPLVRRLEDGTAVAVDGEASALIHLSGARREEDLVDRESPGSPPAPRIRGNIAVAREGERSIELIVEPTGTFPLYVVLGDRGILFSSLIRPLARLVDAGRDPLAVLQFLRDAYTYNGRTVFRGIRRLLPGEVLSWKQGKGAEISHASTLWTQPEDSGSSDSAADSLWQDLLRSVRAAHRASRRPGIMLSAGWDSRTLLAAELAVSDRSNLLAYSHGDLHSREISIVRSLCRTGSVELLLASIDDTVFGEELTDSAFARTETAMFPHWHRAGQSLAQVGVDTVSAGVYGEILGGHYGASMAAHGAAKALSVGLSLLRARGAHRREMTWEDVASLLRLSRYTPPASLRVDFVAEVTNPLEQINADIDADLARLRNRGVHQPADALEAFISEHRGSHFINAQLLSARAFLDVAMPFADPAVLAKATAFPMEMKVHNRLNRIMLGAHARSFLHLPLAATLVPASAPILIQEVSRVARKVREDLHWRAHFASQRRIPPPRLGWVNFEFLRNGTTLQRILGSLQLDIWNRPALQTRIDQVKDYSWREQLHPVFDNFARIVTIDRLLGRF